MFRISSNRFKTKHIQFDILACVIFFPIYLHAFSFYLQKNLCDQKLSRHRRELKLIIENAHLLVLCTCIGYHLK